MSNDWEASFQKDLQTALSAKPNGPRAIRLACDEDHVFHGSLERLPFAQVVRLLHQSRKSGVLVLTEGGREDRVFFRRGEVLAATAGPVRGVAAFHRLLEREFGHFRFEARRVHPARTIYDPTASLLEGGALRAAAGAGAPVPEDAATAIPAPAAFPRDALVSWTVGRASELAGAVRRGAGSVARQLSHLRMLPEASTPADRSRRRDMAVVAGCAALLLSTGIVGALSGDAPASSPSAAPAVAAEGREPDLEAIRATNARARADLAELERRVLLLSGSLVGPTALLREDVAPDGAAPNAARRPPVAAPRTK